jgi:threonine/homoserine/homoserine lactone efflux protein
MNNLVAEVAVLAAGVAVSPVPLGALVLLLGTRRALANAVAFLVGWMVAVCAVGAVTSLVVSGASDGTDRSTIEGAVGLAAGGLLLALGASQLLTRSRAVERVWSRVVDDLRPRGGLAAGLALSGANPKVLALTVAAVTKIETADVTPAGRVIAFAMYAAIASASIGAVLGTFVVARRRRASFLETARAWLLRHGPAVAVGLCLAVGALLVATSLATLPKGDDGSPRPR